MLLNGKWIANTNFKEQLLQVTYQQATQQISNLNTIAKLTFHVNYYLVGLLEVFNGGDLTIKDKFSFDMPPVISETDWQRLRDELFNSSEQFAKKIEQMPDALLGQPFVKEEYGSYLRNIDAIIEHCYYHLGQVSLLRKMIMHDHS
ncbi:MAG: DinB family protein [Chitinophagaceae bacterium]|nr:DinB family protein [Chitinophagaceae bacterium]